MLAPEWWLVNLAQPNPWLPMEFSYKEGGVSKLGGPSWAQHVVCSDSRGRGLISITFRRWAGPSGSGSRWEPIIFIKCVVMLVAPGDALSSNCGGPTVSSALGKMTLKHTGMVCGPKDKPAFEKQGMNVGGVWKGNWGGSQGSAVSGVMPSHMRMGKQIRTSWPLLGGPLPWPK